MAKKRILVMDHHSAGRATVPPCFQSDEGTAMKDILFSVIMSVVLCVPPPHCWSVRVLPLDPVR
jgi:hypothetical protein